MAVELLGSGNDRVEYGDIAAIAGLTGISVAITILPDSPLAGGSRLAGQWGSAGSEEAFLLQNNAGSGTDDVGFVVTGDTTREGRRTTSGFFTAGSVQRIVAKWDAATAVSIWANGSQQADQSWFGGNVSTLFDSPANVFIGHESEQIVDGVNGDYAEFAIWGEEIPDDIAAAYGKGYCPLIYPRNLILYSRLINANDINDIVGGITGSGTGVASADHPRMIYPRRQRLAYPATAAPAADFAPHGLRSLNDGFRTFPSLTPV